MWTVGVIRVSSMNAGERDGSAGEIFNDLVAFPSNVARQLPLQFRRLQTLMISRSP